MLWINKQGFEKYTLEEKDNGAVIFEVDVPFDFIKTVQIGDTFKYNDLVLKIDEIESTEFYSTLRGSLDLDHLKSKLITLQKGKHYSLKELGGYLGVTFSGDVSSLLKLGIETDTAYQIFKAITKTKFLGFAPLSNSEFYVVDFRNKPETATHISHKKLNVISLNQKAEGFEVIDKVIADGKDGVRVTVGDGEKIKYINDQRFSNISALRAYATLIYEDNKSPYREFTLSLAELPNKKINMFDTVQYLGEDSTGEIHRVVGLKRKDGQAEVTLINKRQNLADIFADYQEEQQKVNEELKETDMQLKEYSDNLNEDMQGGFAACNSGIAANKKALEDTKVEFRHTWEETDKKLQSTYEEIDKRIKNARTEYKSLIEQTAREIKLEVSKVETMTKSNSKSIDSAFSQIRINADNITSTVSRVRETEQDIARAYSEIRMNSDSIVSTVSRINEVEGDVRSVSTQVSQKADSWTVSVLQNRIEQVALKLDRSGIELLAPLGNRIQVTGSGVAIQGGLTVYGNLNAGNYSAQFAYINADRVSANNIYLRGKAL